MKKSKKLMILGLSAATAAVAATSAVSSFAWFAINDTVTASGMVIKAKTSEFLEIKKATDDGSSANWKTSVTGLVANTKEVSPVHLDGTSSVTGSTLSSLIAYTDGSATHNWVETGAASASAATKKDGDYNVVTSVADDPSSADNKYTLIADLDLRVHYQAGADANKNYTLSALVDWNSAVPNDGYTIAGGSTVSSYFHNCARVFIVVGNANQAVADGRTGNTVASQGAGYTFSSNYTTTTSSDSATESTAAANVSGDWSNTAKAIKTDLKMDQNGADKLGSGVRVRVFYYFDGEDASCYTDGVSLSNTYSISLTFKVAETQTSSQN